MRRFIAGLVVGLAVGAAVAALVPAERLQGLLPGAWQSPHDAYGDALKAARLDGTELGRAWFAAADEALRAPVDTTIPLRDTLTFRATDVRAFGFRIPLRRGRTLRIELTQASQPAPRVFVDVFRVDGDQRKRVASAAGTSLDYEARADATYVVRIQPELLRDGEARLVELTMASLRFPVEGETARAIESGFGAPRDAGARRHEGVDIFAPRDTRVVAAADGFVSSVGTNRLGGNVVFVWDPRRNLSQYYAHLDRQLVRTGQYVHAGDTIGLVGNTGNARTTPPHLHFGLYAFGGGAIDPAPFLR